jgi:hypothetical protein
MPGSLKCDVREVTRARADNTKGGIFAHPGDVWSCNERGLVLRRNELQLKKRCWSEPELNKKLGAGRIQRREPLATRSLHLPFPRSLHKYNS